MRKLIPGNQKHLTLNDRLFIEKAINEGRIFKDIAKNLCKDPTTISKEVKAHRLSVWKDHGFFVNTKNFCEHRYHCRKTNACGKIILCGIKCASCPTCNQHCPDFKRERCQRLDRAPYVCNGCSHHPSAISARNTVMTRGLQSGSIQNFFPAPGPELIARGRNCMRLIRLYLL